MLGPAKYLRRPGCTLALVFGSWAVLLAAGIGLAALFG